MIMHEGLSSMHVTGNLQFVIQVFALTIREELAIIEWRITIKRCVGQGDPPRTFNKDHNLN